MTLSLVELIRQTDMNVVSGGLRRGGSRTAPTKYQIRMSDVFKATNQFKTLRLRSVTGGSQLRSLHLPVAEPVEASELLTQDFRADGLVP